VQNIVDDINNSDLVGALDDLPANERDTLSAAFLDDIDQLKRLKVLQSQADPKHVDAVQASIKDLKFGNPVTVNDHVQIAQLTGGTVSVSADLSKVPFTAEFLKTLFPHGVPPGQSTTGGNIADAVRSNGGKAIRIATQKVDGRWYPSLFYTVADNAAVSGGAGAPTAADYVPAKGASSPADAVKQLVNALLAGDSTRAIELLSPTELAAVHDYAGLIVKNGAGSPAAPVHIDDLQLTTTPVARGGQSVGLKSVKATTDAGAFALTIDGDCVEVTLPGQSAQRMCSGQLVDEIATQLNLFGAPPLTSAQRAALTHLLSGSALTGGIVTTQTGGQWYVNPVRTGLSDVTTLLARLQGNDLIELIGLIREFGGN
jgi:hypothetical protein